MATATLNRDERTIAEGVHRDPVAFAEHILGHSLWSVGVQALQALAQPRARVAIKGCHASSKTYTAAEAVLWAPFAGGIAITTAPTARQVNQLIWQEIRAMYPRARWPLGGELMLTPHFRISSELYALGLSTDKGVNFAGFHAREGGFMLVVLDEAPGVQPAVYAAIEGIRAGGDVRVLAIGNPDVPSGPFYDAFTRDRAGWQTFTVDAFTSPNFVDETDPGRYLTLGELLDLPEDRLDYAARPYLITRRFAVEKYSEWGLASPLWASKVRGQFPDQAADSLISLAWLEAAKRDMDEPEGDWVAGIDVAGPGEDETVLAIVHGGQLVHLQWWSRADPRGDVLDALEPYRHVLRRINVDSVGLGFYFAKHLEDHDYHGKVVGVNVGAAARDDRKYVNLKAELYWGLRQWFQSGGVGGVVDETLLSQLASIRYEHTPRGQVKIESKEDARKRGVRSPDRAEAVMLAFANVGEAGDAPGSPTVLSRWQPGRVLPTGEEAEPAFGEAEREPVRPSRWRRGR